MAHAARSICRRRAPGETSLYTLPSTACTAPTVPIAVCRRKSVFNRSSPPNAYVSGMTTLAKSAAGLLILLPAFGGLAGCAQEAPRYLLSSAPMRPTSVAMAEAQNRASAAAGDRGQQVPAELVGAAPALNDTGSERIPDFPAGAEPGIVAGGPGVIMPNGGETIVQSTNSLPN